MKRYLAFLVIIFSFFASGTKAQEFVQVKESALSWKQRAFSFVGFNLSDELWKGEKEKSKAKLSASFQQLIAAHITAIRVNVTPADTKEFISLMEVALTYKLRITPVLTSTYSASPADRNHFNDSVKVEWDSLSLASFLALRVKGKELKKQASILSWEVQGEENTKLIALVKTLRALAPHHLVGIELLANPASVSNTEEYLSEEYADYFTISIEPLKRQWTSVDRTYDALPHTYLKTTELLEECLRQANKYQKPLVVIECTYPRDKNKLEVGTSTDYRLSFFSFILTQMNEKRPVFSGVFFSTWKGSLREPQESVRMPYNHFIYDTDKGFLKKLSEEIKRLIIKDL